MRNLHLLLTGLLAIAAASIFAETSNAHITMTFTSLPIAEDLRSTAHKILPYRSGNRVIVIVVDPIMCEQKPINPRFEIKTNRIFLRYDLTTPPAGATQGCTAHSMFELTSVPDGEFFVDFEGGSERVHSAKLAQCPNAAPAMDIWDCMTPTVQLQTTMTFTSIPTVGENLGVIAHKILAYQNHGRLIAIVVDPIICGQRPINARFEIRGHKVSLRYDLTAVSIGAKLGCTAHSVFDLNNVPQSDFEVDFEGGNERVRAAKMERCPKMEPATDIWDCISPPN